MACQGVRLDGMHDTIPNGPWRNPDEETSEYPGLWVHDGRQSGSVTFSKSRLPVWAVVGCAVRGGWEEVESNWDYIGTGYGWTEERFIELLNHVFQLRGDFGRLICALANAERVESERLDAALEEQAPGEAVVKVALGDDDDGVHLPASWWDDDELKAPVVDLLERCLAALK